MDPAEGAWFPYQVIAVVGPRPVVCGALEGDLAGGSRSVLTGLLPDLPRYGQPLPPSRRAGRGHSNYWNPPDLVFQFAGR